jgi:hypothetical protein
MSKIFLIRWRCHDTWQVDATSSINIKVVLFIKATAVLHNMCRMANLPDPEMDATETEGHAA